jgi:LPS export ABC transporter protein LptC
MKKNNFIILFLVFSLFICFISSCTFDYTSFEEELKEEIPNAIIINFSQVRVRDDGTTIEIKADRAEDYEELNHTYFKNVHFIQYDEEQEKLLEGEIEEMIYYTDSENADITGSIYIYSYKDKTSIYAENLNWLNDERILTTDINSTVILKKDDGSMVQGKGFKADLRKREFIFKSFVEGNYVEEENSDE